MDVGLRGGKGDAALIGHAARAGARRMAAGATRLLLPFGQRVPRKLLIAPQDLRTADPTLAGEIYAGHLKLAGKLQETHGRSPFELPPPSLAFAVELHGFGWLRHLSAADSDSPAPTPGRWSRTGSRSARAPPPRSRASPTWRRGA